jgi:hypothetical protein
MGFLKNWRVRKQEEDSEFVYISAKFGIRPWHIGSDTVQGSTRLAHLHDLEIADPRSIMVFLLFNSEPWRA